MTKKIARAVSAAIALLYFSTNCVFAHSAEANFWAERRKNFSDRTRSPQVAQLSPAMDPASARILENFTVAKAAPLSSSLSETLAAALPNNISRADEALLNSLPYAYGQIRHVAFPSGSKANKIIIHIQDVHRNAEAQQNIGKALQGLIDQGGVGLVGLEGGFVNYNLTAFRRFPHQDAVRAVADYLLKQNDITGPIHAALTSDKNIPPFIGVDDPVHYNANVDAYRRSASLMPEYEQRLAVLQKNLAAEKASVFNAALAKFDADVEAYQNKTLPLGDYVQSVARSAANVSPAVQDFLKALSMEKAMDFKVVESERARLIQELVRQLKAADISELMRQSLAYRAGEVRYADFYRYITGLCRNNHVDLNRFPAMRSYIEYVLLAQKIDSEALIKSVAQLEKDGYARLAKTPAENGIVGRGKYLRAVSQLLDFGLTTQGWEEYKSLKDSAAAKEYSSNWDLSPFEAFYREAEARNVALTDNLLKRMDENKTRVAVLVTGGFHSEGAEALLKQKGAAVVTYQPKVTHVDCSDGDGASQERREGATSAYLSVFTQEKTPLEQLFEGEKLFLARDAFPPEMQAEAGAVVPMTAIATSGVRINEVPGLARPFGAHLDDLQSEIRHSMRKISAQVDGRGEVVVQTDLTGAVTDISAGPLNGVETLRAAAANAVKRLRNLLANPQISKALIIGISAFSIAETVREILHSNIFVGSALLPEISYFALSAILTGTSSSLVPHTVLFDKTFMIKGGQVPTRTMPEFLSIQRDRIRTATDKVQELNSMGVSPGLIDKILAELIGNAVDEVGAKAFKEGGEFVGEIHIKIAESGHELIIEVEDDGDGIEGSIFQQILKRRWISTKDASQSIGGAGSGLWNIGYIAGMLSAHVEIETKHGSEAPLRNQYWSSTRHEILPGDRIEPGTRVRVIIPIQSSSHTMTPRQRSGSTRLYTHLWPIAALFVAFNFDALARQLTALAGHFAKTELLPMGIFFVVSLFSVAAIPLTLSVGNRNRERRTGRSAAAAGVAHELLQNPITTHKRNVLFDETFWITGDQIGTQTLKEFLFDQTNRICSVVPGIEKARGLTAGRLLKELILNAVEEVGGKVFIKTGDGFKGKLHIRIIQSDQSVIFEVDDNGDGIEESILQNIMNWKSSSTKDESKSLGGQGLGLGSVLAFAILNSGQVEIETKQEGKNPFKKMRSLSFKGDLPSTRTEPGTRVTVTIPLKHADDSMTLYSNPLPALGLLLTAGVIGQIVSHFENILNILHSALFSGNPVVAAIATLVLSVVIGTGGPNDDSPEHGQAMDIHDRPDFTGLEQKFKQAFDGQEIAPGILTEVNPIQEAGSPTSAGIAAWDRIDATIYVYGKDGGPKKYLGRVGVVWGIAPQHHGFIEASGFFNRDSGDNTLQGISSAVLRRMADIVPAGTTLEGIVINTETLAQLSVMAVRRQTPDFPWDKVDLSYDRNRDGSVYLSRLHRELQNLWAQIDKEFPGRDKLLELVLNFWNVAWHDDAHYKFLQDNEFTEEELRQTLLGHVMDRAGFTILRFSPDGKLSSTKPYADVNPAGAQDDNNPSQPTNMGDLRQRFAWAYEVARILAAARDSRDPDKINDAVDSARALFPEGDGSPDGQWPAVHYAVWQKLMGHVIACAGYAATLRSKETYPLTHMVERISAGLVDEFISDGIVEQQKIDRQTTALIPDVQWFFGNFGKTPIYEFLLGPYLEDFGDIGKWAIKFYLTHFNKSAVVGAERQAILIELSGQDYSRVHKWPSVISFKVPPAGYRRDGMAFLSLLFAVHLVFLSRTFPLTFYPLYFVVMGGLLVLWARHVITQQKNFIRAHYKMHSGEPNREELQKKDAAGARKLVRWEWTGFGLLFGLTILWTWSHWGIFAFIIPFWIIGQTFLLHPAVNFRQKQLGEKVALLGQEGPDEILLDKEFTITAGDAGSHVVPSEFAKQQRALIEATLGEPLTKLHAMGLAADSIRKILGDFIANAAFAVCKKALEMKTYEGKIKLRIIKGANEVVLDIEDNAERKKGVPAIMGGEFAGQTLMLIMRQIGGLRAQLEIENKYEGDPAQKKQFSSPDVNFASPLGEREEPGTSVRITIPIPPAAQSPAVIPGLRARFGEFGKTKLYENAVAPMVEGFGVLGFLASVPLLFFSREYRRSSETIASNVPFILMETYFIGYRGIPLAVLFCAQLMAMPGILLAAFTLFAFNQINNDFIAKHEQNSGPTQLIPEPSLRQRSEGAKKLVVLDWLMIFVVFVVNAHLEVSIPGFAWWDKLLLLAVAFVATHAGVNVYQEIIGRPKAVLGDDETPSVDKAKKEFEWVGAVFHLLNEALSSDDLDTVDYEWEKILAFLNVFSWRYPRRYTVLGKMFELIERTVNDYKWMADFQQQEPSLRIPNFGAKDLERLIYLGLGLPIPAELGIPLPRGSKKKAPVLREPFSTLLISETPLDDRFTTHDDRSGELEDLGETAFYRLDDDDPIHPRATIPGIVLWLEQFRDGRLAQLYVDHPWVETAVVGILTTGISLLTTFTVGTDIPHRFYWTLFIVLPYFVLHFGDRDQLLERYGIKPSIRLAAAVTAIQLAAVISTILLFDYGFGRQSWLSLAAWVAAAFFQGFIDRYDMELPRAIWNWLASLPDTDQEISIRGIPSEHTVTLPYSYTGKVMSVNRVNRTITLKPRIGPAFELKNVDPTRTRRVTPSSLMDRCAAYMQPPSTRVAVYYSGAPVLSRGRIEFQTRYLEGRILSVNRETGSVVVQPYWESGDAGEPRVIRGITGVHALTEPHVPDEFNKLRAAGIGRIKVIGDIFPSGPNGGNFSRDPDDVAAYVRAGLSLDDFPAIATKRAVWGVLAGMGTGEHLISALEIDSTLAAKQTIKTVREELPAYNVTFRIKGRTADGVRTVEGMPDLKGLGVPDSVVRVVGPDDNVTIFDAIETAVPVTDRATFDQCVRLAEGLRPVVVSGLNRPRFSFYRNQYSLVRASGYLSVQPGDRDAAVFVHTASGETKRLDIVLSATEQMSPPENPPAAIAPRGRATFPWMVKFVRQTLSEQDANWYMRHAWLESLSVAIGSVVLIVGAGVPGSPVFSSMIVSILPAAAFFAAHFPERQWFEENYEGYIVGWRNVGMVAGAQAVAALFTVRFILSGVQGPLVFVFGLALWIMVVRLHWYLIREDKDFADAMKAWLKKQEGKTGVKVFMTGKIFRSGTKTEDAVPAIGSVERIVAVHDATYVTVQAKSRTIFHELDYRGIRRLPSDEILARCAAYAQEKVDVSVGYYESPRLGRHKRQEGQKEQETEIEFPMAWAHGQIIEVNPETRKISLKTEKGTIFIDGVQAVFPRTDDAVFNECLSITKPSLTKPEMEITGLVFPIDADGNPDYSHEPEAKTITGTISERLGAGAAAQSVVVQPLDGGPKVLVATVRSLQVLVPGGDSYEDAPVKIRPGDWVANVSPTLAAMETIDGHFGTATSPFKINFRIAGKSRWSDDFRILEGDVIGTHYTSSPNIDLVPDAALPVKLFYIQSVQTVTDQALFQRIVGYSARRADVVVVGLGERRIKLPRSGKYKAVVLKGTVVATDPETRSVSVKTKWGVRTVRVALAAFEKSPDEMIAKAKRYPGPQMVSITGSIYPKDPSGRRDYSLEPRRVATVAGEVVNVYPDTGEIAVRFVEDGRRWAVDLISSVQSIEPLAVPVEENQWITLAGSLADDFVRAYVTQAWLETLFVGTIVTVFVSTAVGSGAPFKLVSAVPLVVPAIFLAGRIIGRVWLARIYPKYVVEPRVAIGGAFMQMTAGLFTVKYFLDTWPMPLIAVAFWAFVAAGHFLVLRFRDDQAASQAGKAMANFQAGVEVAIEALDKLSPDGDPAELPLEFREAIGSRLNQLIQSKPTDLNLDLGLNPVIAINEYMTSPQTPAHVKKAYSAAFHSQFQKLLEENAVTHVVRFAQNAVVEADAHKMSLGSAIAVSRGRNIRIVLNPSLADRFIQRVMREAIQGIISSAPSGAKLPEIVFLVPDEEGLVPVGRESQRRRAERLWSAAAAGRIDLRQGRVEALPRAVFLNVVDNMPFILNMAELWRDENFKRELNSEGGAPAPFFVMSGIQIEYSDMSPREIDAMLNRLNVYLLNGLLNALPLPRVSSAFKGFIDALSSIAAGA